MRWPKSLGARCTGDLDRPGQYLKVLFARRPHAVIRAIDVSRAEALTGVVAVFTAKDVPVNEYGLITTDQPVLCGPGSSKPGAERVRFVGDQIALVVAESEAIASRGRDLISVDYADLPRVTDAREALAGDAPLLFPEKGTNVFCSFRIRKGDAAPHCAGGGRGRGEYHTSQEHAFCSLKRVGLRR
jgi:CO/xanthine dehydrogenase Mo-binding subunit